MTGLEILAFVYIVGFVLILGMGIGHEMSFRNPTYRWVVLAAIIWPILGGREVLSGARQRFRND